MVRQQEWAVQANMFDRDVIGDPVSMLFATSVEEAATALKSNIDKAFKDLYRVLSK
jgi:hypothetical protein